MFKEIKYLNREELKVLLLFVNINDKTLKPNYIIKYEDLILNTFSRNDNDEVNIENVIDNLVRDTYNIYMKLVDKEQEIIKRFKNESSYVDAAKITLDFVKLYEKIMFETKFKNIETLNKQKDFLMKKLNEEINNENYELCAVIKSKIDLIDDILSNK